MKCNVSKRRHVRGMIFVPINLVRSRNQSRAGADDVRRTHMKMRRLDGEIRLSDHGRAQSDRRTYKIGWGNTSVSISILDVEAPEVTYKCGIAS